MPKRCCASSARTTAAPPVQLWWGTLDLALSLYTGKDVEPPPDAGVINRLGGDAAGFWPGDERTRYPAFFAYRCARAGDEVRTPRH